MVYLYLFAYTSVQHDFHTRKSSCRLTVTSRVSPGLMRGRGGGCSVGTLVRDPENQEGACESVKGHIASAIDVSF